MKKENLETGMIVKIRNGQVGMIIGDMVQTYDHIIGEDMWRLRNIRDLKDDLTATYCEDYDIMEVYKVKKEVRKTLRTLLEDLPLDAVDKIYKRFEIPEPGTKVRVKDFEDVEWSEAKFIAYVPDMEYPYVVCLDVFDVATSYQCIEII